MCSTDVQLLRSANCVCDWVEPGAESCGCMLPHRVADCLQSHYDRKVGVGGG